MNRISTTTAAHNYAPIVDSTVCRSWARQLIRSIVPLSWVLNIVLLCTAIAWIYMDGRSLAALESLFGFAGWNGHTSLQTDRSIVPPASELVVLMSCAVATISSVLIALIGFMVGSRRFRTTRAWAVFTVLIAVWLVLLKTWPEIYWRGQQHRAVSSLPSAELTVRSLRANWPSEDGEIDGLGTFLAYPRRAPRTLLLLGDTTLPNSNLHISSIERTPNEAIRFELAGSEQGAWIEWRSEDDLPKSYVGGLRTLYVIDRMKRLAPQWFLVRYVMESSSNADSSDILDSRQEINKWD